MAVQAGELRWHGDEALATIHAAAVRGLRHAGEHILTESRQLVPIDEGTLERSGTVTVDEHELVAAVAYDTPYAVRQHEELDWRHAPGRTAKYLERPLHDEADTVLALIAAQVRRATRS